MTPRYPIYVEDWLFDAIWIAATEHDDGVPFVDRGLAENGYQNVVVVSAGARLTFICSEPKS